MSILQNLFNEFFGNNNASSSSGGRTPDTSDYKEIIVKYDGRLQRITLNKYGEIVKRTYE